MGKTKISWTNETWNPVTGCSKVSPGCANCYAERMDRRIRAAHGEEFKLWTPQNAEYNVRLHPERLEQPLTWKKPRMVFVNSMSDLFHENVPDDFIADIFAVMALATHHTFQVLTKRPERMLKLLSDGGPNIKSWGSKWTFYEKIKHAAQSTSAKFNLKIKYPFSNIWLGVSIENQKAADERIPLLLQTPAAVRFLSCEPLLEEIFIQHLFYASDDGDPEEFRDGTYLAISWVIVGGESGPNFRPMKDTWARSIRNQCHDAGVPFFFKQHSGYRPQENAMLDGVEYHEFPEIAEQ